ncbi:MAG: helix-turn-helix transcriptional regulator [Butyrivibrio sp.]|uniref:helix-turn-helix domain-containing protein n=1 Tax=Butyrivibrio sp. TaxID=28121 RepID=UPI001B01411A|nr:helix-turn-helix transcriptional regulator [Butyrivibrio sp.]MBO5622728.1 helix-turn-helix transcriptional regulator [Butyrivibrio sp.]MBP3274667.1 helix-turn-helix transcriptional regulator [Butyrivibrio sp.]MBP3784875.1 helix-turn-helix transcriptional regulator [Butyrivibrio sp.]
MDGTSLGKRLRELREFNGYTQEYVSELLGVVRQTYSHYENGKRTPDPEQLCKLTDIYKCSLDDLLKPSHSINELVHNRDSDKSEDISHYIEFINSPDNYKKYQRLDKYEKEICYYFSQMRTDDKKEMIAFSRIKAKRSRGK